MTPEAADELQQLRAAKATILSDHWKGRAEWGGEMREVCGRCRYGDGVSYLWPCPTRRALTGELAPQTGDWS